MIKLKSILLVDDDEPTNFLHKMIIGKTGFVEEVATALNGIEALKYIKDAVKGKHPEPDLIFLDINMPAMNGWEFLEEYKKLDDVKKRQFVVVMLTTSLNPDDKKRAEEEYGIVNGFINKPLTKDILREIIEKHFN